MADSRPESSHGQGGNRGPRGGKRSNNNNEDPMIRLSKTMSFLLRHGAAKEGLSMRTDGFVAVDDMLALRQFKGKTISDIEAVVRDNNKQRFALMQDDQTGQWFVRANQGHSIEVEVEMAPITDSAEAPLVVHGTLKKNLESICLSRMSRKHIHFAVGRHGGEGVISGMRANCDTFIYVDLPRALQDGIVFLRSANNVILTEGINGTLESKYFCRVVERDNKQLWPQPDV